MLRYQDFLNRVVDLSKEAATADYQDIQRVQLEGSLAGLEICRDKSPVQLATVLERARRVHQQAFHQTNLNRYWRVTCFMHEVEWVCNVVSVVLMNQGMEGIIPPTMRAALFAQKIINEFEGN